jgi:hypothetical protein
VSTLLLELHAGIVTLPVFAKVPSHGLLDVYMATGHASCMHGILLPNQLKV